MPTRAKNVLNFTKAAIAAVIAAPPGKRAYYSDTKIRSLQLVVTDRGAKSFVLYRRIAGRPTRYFLGTWPDLTPENARKKAEGIAGRVAFGEDVVQSDRLDHAREITLEDAFTQFKRVRSNLKPSTVHHYQGFLKLAFAPWKARALVKITKDQVAERHRALTREHGPCYADGAMRFLRSLLNFASSAFEAPDGTPLLPENPVSRLSRTRAWNGAKRRTTVIRPAELKAWFGAVGDLPRPPGAAGFASLDNQGALVADFLVLLLLTGLRRSEGARLRWADVDLEGKTLTVRDTKNRDDHTLPLSDYLHELLERRRKVTEGDFVFPGTGKDGCLTEPRPQMAKVIKASGVPFTLHDLRRTFATVAESLDIPAYALKRLLNHRSQDVTFGYVIVDVDRLRKPMQSITDYMLKWAGIRGSATVTPISGTAA
jgi:integrase